GLERAEEERRAVAGRLRGVDQIVFIGLHARVDRRKIEDFAAIFDADGLQARLDALGEEFALLVVPVGGGDGLEAEAFAVLDANAVGADFGPAGFIKQGLGGFGVEGPAAFLTGVIG